MKFLISSLSILALTASVVPTMVINNHSNKLLIKSVSTTSKVADANLVRINNQWTSADINSAYGGGTWIENYDLTNATGIISWDDFKSNHAYFAFNGGSDDDHLSTQWLHYYDSSERTWASSHHSIIELHSVVHSSDFYARNYYLDDSDQFFSYGAYWHNDSHNGHLIFSVNVYVPNIDPAYGNWRGSSIRVSSYADWWA